MLSLQREHDLGKPMFGPCRGGLRKSRCRLRESTNFRGRPKNGFPTHCVSFWKIMLSPTREPRKSRSGVSEERPGAPTASQEAVCTIATEVFVTPPKTVNCTRCRFYRQGAGIRGAENGKWPEVYKIAAKLRGPPAQTDPDPPAGYVI